MEKEDKTEEDSQGIIGEGLSKILNIHKKSLKNWSNYQDEIIKLRRNQ